MGRKFLKRGFTLIETVVTVGIIATMAAVVIPQVTKQFDAADPTRIQNDLKNLQSAVETFNVNVKVMPGDIDDLANQIVVTNDSSLTSAAAAVFTSTQTPLWKGPYVDATIADNTTTTDFSLTTGYGAKILDSFVCFASTTGDRGTSEGSSAGAGTVTCPSGAGFFLAFQITGIACSTTAGSTFLTVNSMFDGSAETNPDTEGRIRCAAAGGSRLTDIAVVWYLAVPIS